MTQVSALLTDAQRLQNTKDLLTSLGVKIPDSLQLYPGFKRKGGIANRCVTCHKVLGHNQIVVKENGWEHAECWKKRMEEKK